MSSIAAVNSAIKSKSRLPRAVYNCCQHSLIGLIHAKVTDRTDSTAHADRHSEIRCAIEHDNQLFSKLFLG